MPLTVDDLTDARNLLNAAGLDAGTFTFDYVPYPRLGCGAGPPPADIIVTNAATGVRRIYAAKPGSNWLTAFGDHVAQHLY